MADYKLDLIELAVKYGSIHLILLKHTVLSSGGGSESMDTSVDVTHRVTLQFSALSV